MANKEWQKGLKSGHHKWLYESGSAIDVDHLTSPLLMEMFDTD